MQFPTRTVFSNLVLYLVIITLSIIFITVIGTNTLSSLYYSQVEGDLKETAELIGNEIKGLEFSASVLDSKCKKMGDGIITRITLISPDGTVIGDSAAEINGLENHARRPEVHKALLGEASWEARYSKTLKSTLLYFAMPFRTGEKISLVIRTSVPVQTLENKTRVFIRNMLIIASITLAVSLSISTWIARRISIPLRLLTNTAAAYAQEDFEYYAEISHPQEIMNLARTMRKMANIIQDRMRLIREQKNKLSAVLSSMVEAVIVLNEDLIIEDLNDAAEALVHQPGGVYKNRALIDVYRNTGLRDFAKETMESGGPLEREILFTPDPEDSPGDLHRSVRDQYIQAHGTILKRLPGDNGPGKDRKIVIVLHDITRIKEVDRIRKDFVANVSHELKTPITSIKGFVETLLDGAMENESTAKHFLSIIQKQSEQLNAIIDDLLSLSRLEKHNGKEPEFENFMLYPLLTGAVQVCSEKARKKDIKITLDSPQDCTLKGNPVLIEQAIVNLLDNALKYSTKETKISIEVHQTQKTVEISVTDEGRGIPKDDLPRIFERFYRVDKARSREMGGTGLGLSIVKHIVLSHQGEVRVKSKEGVGSTFIIQLPV